VVEARRVDGVGHAGGAQDRQRASVERHGFVVPALVLAQHAQVIEGAAEVQIARAEVPLGQCHGALAVNVALGIPAKSTAHAAQRTRRLDPQPPDVAVVEACVTRQQTVGPHVRHACFAPAIHQLERGADLQEGSSHVRMTCAFVLLEQHDRTACSGQRPARIGGDSAALGLRVQGDGALYRIRAQLTPGRARALRQRRFRRSRRRR
jgi:hypothetical protein